MRALAIVLLVLALVAAAPAEVVWDARDARPVPEPAEDDEGDFIWWDGAWAMTFYQFGKVLDLGTLGRSVGESLGLVGPREAWNVNALDEVPDSTWFTNRHHLRPRSPRALARGPNQGAPPSRDGPLRIRSGKALGQSPGFLVEDERGHRYLVKFDPPSIPDMATGAEMVSSKILHALGWNVPEYHLFRLDPDRLEVGPGATTKDKYGRKRPLTSEDVDRVLERAARRPDGLYRAIASRLVPGAPKGPFRTLGVRPDDPNDRVPHQHRRDLRGLRVVSAWIHYTDARRGNFYDTFVPHEDDPEGRGHLEHYLLDFSSTLGSGNVAYKDPKDGHEYFVDPPVIFRSLFSLGLWVKPWEDPPPVREPALGTFGAEHFDPERWRTRYPNPLFDHATVLDEFWGARLVASFRDADLRIAVAAGEWSNPDAAEALFRILRERRDTIAATWFRTERILPADRFVLEDGWLRYVDLAVRSGLVPPARARYAFRIPGAAWEERDRPEARVPVGEGVVELRASHDGGRSWSPVTRVRVSGGEIAGIERETG